MEYTIADKKGLLFVSNELQCKQSDISGGGHKEIQKNNLVGNSRIRVCGKISLECNVNEHIIIIAVVDDNFCNSLSS